MSDLIDRQAAIDRAVSIPMFGRDVKMVAVCEIKNLPSAQIEIVRCKDCKYGEQDEIGRWYCRGLGCQIGDDDGSGFCADAERRTDEND